MKMIGDIWYVLLMKNGGHATAQTVLIDWPIWSGKTRNTDALRLVCWFFSTNKKIMP
jgi:hypothetical protein